MSKVVVTVTQNYPPYKVGDVIGVTESEADEMVEAGAAVKGNKASSEPEDKSMDAPDEDKQVKSPHSKK